MQKPSSDNKTYPYDSILGSPYPNVKSELEIVSNSSYLLRVYSVPSRILGSVGREGHTSLKKDFSTDLEDLRDK